MKHTPGPWHSKTSEPSKVYAYETDRARDRLVADCRSAEVSIKQGQANALLVAASPKMLAALFLVRHHLGLQKLFTPLGVALELAKPIEEAIKAATGEEWPDG